MQGTDSILDQVLAYIQRHPGVRASEINRALELDFSWKWRLMLLERSLVRCEQDGPAVRYFAVILSD